MANIFANLKEKVTTTFAMDDSMSNTGVKNNIHPRANKEVTVGVAKTDLNSDSTTQNRIFDTSDDICVIRGVKLVEDGGNYMLSVINRLEEGQLIVVDFSESDEKSKELQFYALWGASMAFHGSYRVLDKAGNLVLFTSSENKISEDRSLMNS